MTKKRIRFIFTGRVQGVGFRYTAYHICSSLGITGFVKNEWDGSVLLEAQGNVESLQKILTRLEKSPFIRIENVEQTEIPLKEESTFSIEY